jgi:hypothetical protein
VNHITPFAPNNYGNLGKACRLSPINAAEIADDQTARIHGGPCRRGMAIGGAGVQGTTTVALNRAVVA